jgi:protein TonB
MSDVARPVESRRSRLGRWVGAAALVGALHVGGVALALMGWHEEAEDDPAGAMMVEMAPLPRAARIETRELAHGPLTPAVLPQPEATEKVQEEEVTEDLPPVPPSPAPEPEIALPMQPPEKSEPETEKIKQIAPERQRPSQAAEQQIAMAPPRVDAPPERKASHGQSTALTQLHARWTRAVERHLARFRSYPEAARRRGQHGTVRVRIRVDRSGHLLSAQMLKGSGAQLLDEEAFVWLKRSSPFPLPPDLIPESELELTCNIGFKIE